MYETLLTNKNAPMPSTWGLLSGSGRPRDLNYEKYFSKGIRTETELKQLNSDNVVRLSTDQVKEKLLS
jgi:UDP-glucose 4-epimerase